MSWDDDRITMDDCMFKMDGNMWCCHLPDFQDLMQSPAGFGETQEDAFANFLENWRNGV